MTDAPTRAMRWTAPGWRSTVVAAVGWVVLAAMAGAVFPRATRWMLWPHGLSPRGRLVHAVVTGALMFATKELAHHLLLSREELVAELRDELRREPTDDEIQRRLHEKMARARDVAFSSYAVPTIVGEIKRHDRDRSRLLHVPRAAQEPRAER